MALASDVHFVNTETTIVIVEGEGHVSINLRGEEQIYETFRLVLPTLSALALARILSEHFELKTVGEQVSRESI